MSEKVWTIRETTPADNWPVGRRPQWVEENSRLYAGFKLRVAGRDWREILTLYDGAGCTTAYVTASGFDPMRPGPALHRIKARTACHRRVIREWFRDFCGVEVEFK